MTEEQTSFVVTDIDGLSLSQATQNDLTSKNINASSEINGVTLLKKGAEAETEPLNNNFIYLSSRLDNMYNNLSECASAMVDYKTYILNAKNEMEQTVEDNSIYTKTVSDGVTTESGEFVDVRDNVAYVDYTNVYNIRKSPSEVSLKPTNIVFDARTELTIPINSHTHYSVKKTYTSLDGKDNDTPAEIEAFGVVNFVYTRKAAKTINIAVPGDIVDACGGYYTISYRFLDFAEQEYWNAQISGLSYSSTAFNPAELSISWKGQDGYISIDVASSSSSYTRRCKLIYNVKSIVF